MSNSSSVSTIAGLNSAIITADSLMANSGTYTITLTSNITLGSTALEAINLNTGVVLDIVGGGYDLIGGGTTTPERGLFVYAGTVSIQNLLIEDMDAVGGNGASGGGGGAGLGGGLFISSNVSGDAGSVTLNNVSFNADRAVGGSGSAGGAGGGGGLGGNGASAEGGGGGIGGAAGHAGIVPRAGGGGAGSRGSGGASGGGGGQGFASTSSGGGGGGGGVGGGRGYSNAGPAVGGNGGFGGGGGGAIGDGGKGGFGGGGGAGGGYTAGQGGFGGGGAEQGKGGFGGGSGSTTTEQAGGGLGAGGDIFVQGGASLTIQNSSSIAAGTVVVGSASVAADDGQAFGAGIYLQGTGAVLTFSSPGTTETIAAPITDDKGAATAASYAGASGYTEGSTGIATSGTVVLTGTNTYTGGTTIEAGTLTVGSAANLGSGAIDFTAVNATLALTSKIASGMTFADPLTGFATDGRIDLTSLAFVSGATATLTGTTLTLVDGGTTEYFTMSAAAGTTPFTVQSDGGSGLLLSSTSAACYMAGTRIATPDGEVAVEDLRVGDRVVTVLGGATAPIAWIGSRRVDCTRHPRPTQVWPVRVRAGAFGPGAPSRDLFLSPDHAVYVGDVLVPVRCLIDGDAITQVRVDSALYFHLELPEHDLLLAEGLAAESYLDVGDSRQFDGAGGPIRLFPEFAPPAADLAAVWETRGCARLVVCGPALEAARRQVVAVARAAA